MALTDFTRGFDRRFVLDVAMGKIPGHSQLFVIGVQPDFDIVDGTVTLWDVKGVALTLLTVATELFLSSSDAGDTTQQVLVTGLDINWIEKTEIITLTGQTQVTATTGWFRITSMASVGTTLPDGDVYLAPSTSLTAGVPDDLTVLQSKMLSGLGITHNGFFHIPAAHSGIVMANRGTVDSTNKNAEIQSWISFNAGAFVNPVTYTITNGFPEFTFPLPVGSAENLGILSPVLPEKTTVELRANVGSNDTAVFFGEDILLIENQYFGR